MQINYEYLVAPILDLWLDPLYSKSAKNDQVCRVHVEGGYGTQTAGHEAHAKEPNLRPSETW